MYIRKQINLLRKSVPFFSLVLLVSGCSTNSFDSLSKQYTDQVREFASHLEQYPIEQKLEYSTDQTHNVMLHDSLSAFLAKDNRINEWANDSDIVTLVASHIYNSGKTSGTDAFPVIVKELSPPKYKYLHEYSKTRTNYYSFDLTTKNGIINRLDVTEVRFTETPAYYFSDKTGYIQFQLLHVRGSEAEQESMPYFTMIVTIPK